MNQREQRYDTIKFVHKVELQWITTIKNIVNGIYYVYTIIINRYTNIIQFIKELK